MYQKHFEAVAQAVPQPIAHAVAYVVAYAVAQDVVKDDSDTVAKAFTQMAGQIIVGG